MESENLSSLIKLSVSDGWPEIRLFKSVESWLFYFIVFQMSCFCKCFVALLHGAVGWSAVSDCGIS